MLTYQLIRESTPVARKPHRCIWCGEAILVGVKHWHEISKYDVLQNHRWHQECREASCEYFLNGDGPEFSPYENERPMKEAPHGTAAE